MHSLPEGFPRGKEDPEGCTQKLFQDAGRHMSDYGAETGFSGVHNRYEGFPREGETGETRGSTQERDEGFHTAKTRGSRGASEGLPRGCTQRHFP